MRRPEQLQGYLEQQAIVDPDATAVVLGAERLTYGELDDRSSRLARVLVDAGCRTGDRVCVLAAKSPRVILAMHAALKAGCCYVPVDAESPAARIERIVRVADPQAVIVDAAGARMLEEADLRPPLVASIATPDEPPVQQRQFGFEDLDSVNPSTATPARAATDAAHILFTSGSTGLPKGVVVTHANVIAFVEWARPYFGIRRGDRVSGHSPLHFDLSTFDVFGALSAGAELHLTAPQLNLLAPKLVAYIREARLHQWFSVPSAMNLIARFDAIPSGSLPHLERVIWCGEVLPTPTLAYWMERVPKATFTNLYGPTETTIASSYYRVPALPSSPTEPIPIGVACPGEELLVLDRELSPVRPAEQGDLYIGGAGVTAGYWRDEHLTRQVFIPDPRPDRSGVLYRTGDLARVGMDGLVYFLGRQDSQIKSRGHRIELGEIEVALATLAEIADFAVVPVTTGGFEGTSIGCAYTTKRAIAPSAVKRELRRLLPGYMIPTLWRLYGSLPTNANGKIDRAAIRRELEETHGPAT
jgi:amino acid adenylation domain-containing protein